MKKSIISIWILVAGTLCGQVYTARKGDLDNYAPVVTGVTFAVTSVNSQTGDVVITASDLGALTNSPTLSQVLTSGNDAQGQSIFNLGYIYDQSQSGSKVDIRGSKLHGSNNVLSVDWQGRKLIGTNGTDVIADWSTTAWTTSAHLAWILATDATNIAEAVVGLWTNRITTAWQNPASATNWTWTSDGAQITLIGYTGPSAVVIPDMLDGLPVVDWGTLTYRAHYTSISGGKNIKHLTGQGLAWNDTITSMDLPYIETVGYETLSYCLSLTNITLGNVKTVEYRALRGNPLLQSVSFSGNAPVEGSEVFYNSSTNIIIYVTNPTATGWTNTWNGMPVVRLPLYGNLLGNATTATTVTGSQSNTIATALQNGQTNVTLGLASGSTAETPTEATHITNKHYVDTRSPASVLYYVGTNTFVTADGQTNFVYRQPPPPAGGSRTYTAPTLGQYLGSSIVTNLTGFSTPMLVSSFQGISSTIGGRSMSIVCELYYSIDGGATWLGDWTSESRAMTTGTNQYDYSINVVPYSGSCILKRVFKVSAVNSNPNFILYYGTNSASSIAFDQPGLPAYELTSAKITAAGGALATDLSNPYKTFTGTITPANGTATVIYAHGNMPSLTLSSATVITLNPTSYGTSGVSRVSLNFYSGTNSVTLATNVITYATAPTISTNAWNTILIRRVSDSAWKGVGL